MKVQKYAILMSRFIFLIVFFIFVYPQNIIADAKYEHFDDGTAAFRNGDYKTAAKEFTEAAKTGDYRAMTILGSMYIEGLGVEKDYKKAYRWFSQGAKYNLPEALYQLGLMYDKGIGVSKNYKKAAQLYNKAARKGYAPAQHLFGLLYAKGNGVKQSNVKAYAWLVVAGILFSNVLPEVKEEGAETKQDTDELETEDKRLEEVFAPRNLDLITVELKRIRKEMTPEQLEETKQLIPTYMKYRKKYRVVKLKEGQLSSEDKYLYFPDYLY